MLEKLKRMHRSAIKRAELAAANKHRGDNRWLAAQEECEVIARLIRREKEGLHELK